MARGRVDVFALVHLLLINFDDVCIKYFTIDISPAKWCGAERGVCGRVGILRKANVKLDSFFTECASHETGFAEPQSSSRQLVPIEVSKMSIESALGCYNDAEKEGVSNTFVDTLTATPLEETSESLDPEETPVLADNG